MNTKELSAKSIQYRRDLLTFIVNTGAGRTGGSLSSVDIINVLYNAVMDITPDNWNGLDRDFYVQSKGHSVEALYVWRSFGWDVHQTDGHDVAALGGELRGVPFASGRPSLLIAHTKKGRGVSFIEGRPDWHHHLPSPDDYERAIAELDRQAVDLAGAAQ